MKPPNVVLEEPIINTNTQENTTNSKLKAPEEGIKPVSSDQKQFL
jgi:hypothetical protein